MEESDKPSFSAGRRFGVSLTVALGVLAAVALVLMVNYLAARYFRRLSLSGQPKVTLSERTLSVLAALTNDVKVIVYYDKDNDLYPRITELLKEYRFLTPKLQLQFVDYIRDHGQAQSIRAEYQLSELNTKDLVIFECNKRTRIVRHSELADIDTSGIIEGKTNTARRTHFKGELMFTSAISRVASGTTFKAYFVQGHNEHPPDSDDPSLGYVKFKDQVLREENNLEVGKLSLLGSGEIPSDCSLLIIAGPRDGYVSDELEKIEKYLNQGGRLLLLFNAFGVNRKTGLEKLLASWGVEVGDDQVIDMARSLSRTGDDLAILEFGTHDLIRPLRNTSLHLVKPRSVRKIEAARQGADVPSVQELAFTSEDSLIRRGLTPATHTHTKAARVPVMAAVERGVRGLAAQRGATRIVVVGDSLFLDNETLDTLGNRDFASHAINWLLDRNELLAGLTPRPITEYRISMTRGQRATVRWILLLGMPGAVLLLGLLVWSRRRN